MPDPGVVEFDYGAWVARYPEFATLDANLAEAYFNEATLLLNNTGTSLVQDLAQRSALLNMLTAHIAAINNPATGGGSGALVGRVTSASQGSVSVSVEPTPGANPQIAWFYQTKYGAAYWNATARYRLPQYRPGPQPFLGSSRYFPWGRYGSGWPY